MNATRNLGDCDRQQQVLDALFSGRWAGPWGEEIRRHAAGCPTCSEMALVAQALQYESLLAAEESSSGLPSAGLVWWKAQRAALRAAEERAAQPITLVSRVAQAFGGLAVAGTALWQWPRIAAWLEGRHVAHAAEPAAAAGAEWLERLSEFFAHPASGVLVAASAAAFLMLMLVAAYVAWREE